MSGVVLHGYWRSSAAYRVRMALNLKGVAYTQINHDLRIGAQRDDAYLAIAPHGLVPALQVDGRVLIESPAILEWIDARWPEPTLLPRDEDDKAIVRSMAALIACDIHPLNNLRILKALKHDFGADQAQIDAWTHRWIGAGFGALEQMIARHGDGFAFGDAPTLADCYLVPQLFNARRSGVDLTPYPALVAAGDKAAALTTVAAARPDVQPDADR
ncbi:MULTISPECIES: maleylacetoacetate isomerase [Sphingobium]|uniref:Maleylacetoacetate isomerase n=1 Tax=Sphingobium cupriresistens LL01 TaxID=1420583 RepID=A0A0J7XYJ7_9SPHN|nr:MULTISPECIES: maleylacetoacetate isomerase [Sphingobium]KMS56746.1 maleylacetoacetate isomerase [Sphingobium cupriresistens LL01]WCP13714.1 Maleylpyruvate isomerase [Sphingobium sp. AntQ-1]